jgi:uncharacterized membrane protein
MKITVNINFTIIIVLLAALVLRLFNLGYDGLWHDELLTAVVTHPENSVIDVVNILKGDVHPPLHPVLTNIFCTIFGHNDITLRLINVLMGVWGVFAGYLLAKELFNKKVALYALGLLVLNSFLIRYSQEARSYAQLSVFANYSFLYFVRLLKNDFERKNAIYYVLTTAAMLYTHYFALFVLASQFVAFFFFMDWKRFKQKLWYYIVTFAMPNILFLYWIQFILKRADRPFQSWRDPATPGVILEYLEIFFNDKLLMFLSLLTLVISVLYLAARRVIKHKWFGKFDKDAVFGVSILMIWLLVYFFIPYLRSNFDTSMMVNRYFVPLVVPVVILLAFYLQKIPGALVRNGVFILICGYSIYVLFSNTNPYYAKTTMWRETVDHLYELDRNPYVWYMSRDRRYWNHYLRMKNIRRARTYRAPFEKLLSEDNYPDSYYVLVNLRAPAPKYKDSIPALEGYKEVYSKDFFNNNKIADSRLIKYERIEEVNDSL